MNQDDIRAIWMHIQDLNVEIFDLEMELLGMVLFDGNREERLEEMIAEAKAELSENIALVWGENAQ